MMRSSDNTDNLIKAMVEAAPEITAVPKTKENGFAGYRYATLDSLIDMLRKVLPKHGLWFIQIPTSCESYIELRTRVIHISGEWIEDSIMFGKTDTAKSNDTQKIGSSITYFRRYALSSIFGVASDDDTDGADQPQQPNARPIQQPNTKPHPAQNSPKKRDPMPYLMAVCARRLAEGETRESILRDFAEILKTDQVREIADMTDDERSFLARAIYKKYGNAPMVQVVTVGGDQ
jgi:hypothetical protein